MPLAAVNPGHAVHLEVAWAEGRDDLQVVTVQVRDSDDDTLLNELQAYKGNLS